MGSFWSVILIHPLHRRIEDRAGLLRIEAFHQVHRSLDVREQRCDRLALPSIFSEAVSAIRI